MLRTVVRLSPSFLFPFLENRNEYDANKVYTAKLEEPKTGFERLKRMYTKDEFGEVSVELHNVVQASMFGAFFGACMGGFFQSKNAYMYFIENNQATIFKTTAQAQKKLQDYVTVAFARGAYHWGWRLGIFSGMFTLIATSISAYRGTTSVVEYTVAGAITGALYKANLGLAASLVGAGLGASLSTIGGLGIIGILKLSGFTMDDIRNAMYKIKEARVDQYNQALEKASKIKHDDLTRHHEKKVASVGEKAIQDL